MLLSVLVSGWNCEDVLPSTDDGRTAQGLGIPVHLHAGSSPLIDIGIGITSFQIRDQLAILQIGPSVLPFLRRCCCSRESVVLPQ